MREAFIVGAILFCLWFLEKALGTPMVIRPIVVSSCVGLGLGDLHNGVLIGATLELMFMGAIQIGGSVPPDVLAGAGLGAAFAIITNKGPEVALALALPISVLAQSIKVVIFIVRSQFMNVAIKFAENNEITKMKALNWFGLVLQSSMYFAVAFLAILFGSNAVESFVNSIPDMIMSSLQLAGGLLPAVGFALLLQPMIDKKNVLYFILGFIAVTYLELPIMAITIFSLGIAYIVVFEKNDSNNEVVLKNEEKTQSESWEELFDE